ncbi:hypothetical protein CHARACLAT_011487 [Characodon lateralis]|uniref:Uncharacterized protein n=1 Tax=Characodon lateralis TaxID=208331 RepID=A0ABU7F2S0_9TELE|nr:hypothetical protein [Characodon lateralis]
MAAGDLRSCWTTRLRLIQNVLGTFKAEYLFVEPFEYFVLCGGVLLFICLPCPEFMSCVFCAFQGKSSDWFPQQTWTSSATALLDHSLQLATAAPASLAITCLPALQHLTKPQSRALIFNCPSFWKHLLKHESWPESLNTCHLKALYKKSCCSILDQLVPLRTEDENQQPGLHLKRKSFKKRMF